MLALNSWFHQRNHSFRETFITFVFKDSSKMNPHHKNMVLFNDLKPIKIRYPQKITNLKVCPVKNLDSTY